MKEIFELAPYIGVYCLFTFSDLILTDVPVSSAFVFMVFLIFLVLLVWSFLYYHAEEKGSSERKLPFFLCLPGSVYRARDTQQ